MRAKRTSILLATFMLASCQQSGSWGSGVYDDTHETSDTQIPPRDGTTPINVVIGEPNSRMCGQIASQLKELAAKISTSQPSKSGYRFSDVNEETSVRFYFKAADINLPDQANYAVCSGTGSPFVASRCLDFGVTHRTCYQVSSYKINSFEDLDYLGMMAKRNWK